MGVSLYIQLSANEYSDQSEKTNEFIRWMTTQLKAESAGFALTQKQNMGPGRPFGELTG